MSRPATNLPIGAVQMVVAAMFFALMAALVQRASERLPGAQVVFARNAVGLLFITPLALRQGLAGLRTPRFAEHALRAGAGLGSMYCFFYAIHHLRLADAVLLNYTLPLFLPIVEATWLREPMPRRLWGPLLLGFAGVVLVLKPGLGLFQTAALVGLSAGLLSAVAQTGIRRMTSTEPTARIIFYFAFLATLVSAPPALVAWAAPTGAQWLVLVGAGAAGTCGQIFMTRAYARAPAAQVGAFIYASVPFAVVFDWLGRGRLPDAGSVAGAFLICGAGAVMLRAGAHRRPPAPPPPPESRTA
jgi:drug/metabolite transporter (DMT)-like permease